MTEPVSLVPAIYVGWHQYQALLIKALTPLTGEQLELWAAPHLRSIDEIGRHIVANRANWFYQLMSEGGDVFAALAKWGLPEMPPRSAAELAQGLETTWQGMQTALARWTPVDWQQTYPGEVPYEPATITRPWVIWHLIEHDLHHGGEISLTLGLHGLVAPAL
jgi:uncharacterized damage-inducible protein DinB